MSALRPCNLCSRLGVDVTYDSRHYHRECARVVRYALAGTLTRVVAAAVRAAHDRGIAHERARREAENGHVIARHVAGHETGGVGTVNTAPARPLDTRWVSYNPYAKTLTVGEGTASVVRVAYGGYRARIDDDDAGATLHATEREAMAWCEAQLVLKGGA